MQTATCNETGFMTIAEVPQPQPGAGELLVRVRACGVCGTDLLKIYNATVAKPTQLGHEVVGEVAQVGAGVTGWRIGQRLALAHHVPCYVCHFCRHGNFSMCALFKETNIRPGGFSEYVIAPAPHVAHTALPLPDTLPDERAIFVEPLACCVRALKRVPPLLPGDTALVVGAGAIGQLFLALLQLQPVQSIALDPKAARREQARGWGAALALDPGDTAAPAAIRAATAGRGADLAVLTVANAATFAQALALLRDGGTLLIFGAKPGDAPAPTNLWDIYRREITITSSYSPSPTELWESLALLQRPGMELEHLVTHRLPLARIQEGIELGRAQTALKVVINP